MTRPRFLYPNQMQAGRISPSGLAALAVVALLFVLGWGVVELFNLRHERGDVYPPYSTLRADPLGAKAIYDTFAGMPGFQVTRNFRPLVRLKPEEPVTLVYAGVDFRARWAEDELAEFESLLTTGTRAVFVFHGQSKSTSETRLRPSPRSKKAKATPAPPGTTPVPKKRGDEEDDEDEAVGVPFRDAVARWGLAFDLAQDEVSEIQHGKAERDEAAGELEGEVPWHSALYFKGLNAKWRVLYRCNGVPVVAERDFGRGSIVVASDSFFLSNEGLRTARAPKLIARLFGPPRTIVFDEEHHGVTEEMNIAGLARKHGLEGAVFASLFVVALFVWKNAVPFLPARADRAGWNTDVAGADATTGFIKLLRRSIPASGILKACVERWRQAQGRHPRPEEVNHIDTVLRSHEAKSLGARNPAAAYRTIAQGLRRS